MDLKTSTPIVLDKLIPPPPRKLWATDSPTEQLYRNKWTKYRNSMEGNEIWSVIEAPRFIDFEDIPEARDTYFDNAEEGENTTPQRTLAKRLPGLDSDNNNTLLESLNKCCLSAIESFDKDETLQSSFNLLNNKSGTLKKHSDSKIIKANNQNKADFKAPKPPDYRGIRIKSENVRSGNTKVDKKNRSDNSNGSGTIVEPFSFEIREKSKQEHRQARRERDSIGKETWKGFRANPMPNFFKIREKNRFAASTACADKKNKINEAIIQKLQNAGEVGKKKAFEPSNPKKVPIKLKPPQLLTAVRARERQRFEEQMKAKELQRQAILKMEEAARKKREEEEIAKLRKQLVHKAQPIRKYKLIIPRVEKRPLADPMTPMTCKRRRML